jgi:N12 class adenine-specific DNA methylase
LAAARRNTLNAHYTDAALVTEIWQAAQDLGFTTGSVLEPGCGSGNFIGFAPPGAHMTGIELDPITAGIAQHLYPAARIEAGSFADTRDPDNTYDLTIGNVPFAAAVLHDRRHNRQRHSLHNHFIVKSLHLTRPGGLVIVLTSRYTMDARNPAARREIASLADLVGAIRLPSGAHQRGAGTTVVTDLLILRRRDPGRVPDPTAWEQSRPTTIDNAELTINEYFLANPAKVLGTLAATNGAYSADDLVVRPTADTAEALRTSLTTITASAKSRDLTWTPAPDQEAAADPPAAPPTHHPEGHLSALTDGTFTRVTGGTERPHSVPRTQARELRALLALRDTARTLLDTEAASPDDTTELREIRDRLNRQYDSYLQTFGPLNRYTVRRTGRTDPSTGDPVLARIQPPQGSFRIDPLAPLVYALEEFEPAGQRAAKASIFRGRVVAPREPRLGADTPADALAICLDTCGEIRLPEIARLLGVPEPEARAQLSNLVFDDPATGTLVPAAQYLSGNVREKLHLAEKFAQAESRYQANVAELTRVIPADLGPGEIEARLGAAWIDATIVRQFLRELLDDPDLSVEHPGGQIWAVKGRTTSVLAASTWGTGRYPAPALAQSLLEQRKIEVRDQIKTPHGYRSVVNLDATMAAQEKATELAGRFSDWAWENPARAAALAASYNDRFNNLVLRNYDNATLSLPGLAITFRPRPHQVAAVARMISEPAVLLAHEVGAGKTAEMIMGITELRRLSLARKPAIVVPNHMLDQFSREWLQLYPQARILIARREDLQQARRREFVARCATGTWDGIVMSRSAFERIPLSPANQRTYLERELGQIRDWIKAAKSGGGLTVKRLEATLLRAEERLRAKLDSAKDPGITFEATGIDYLCIDEAHGYKNLYTASNMPDASIDGSMRASDLDMKIDYLRRRNGCRVVTFATATPIANSVTEAYVMQRYLRPDLLEDAGITAFDSWAATFGKVVTQVELAPEGGDSFRLKSRFASFQNVPEMLKMLHVAADVKTADDLKLPVPLLVPREDGQRAPVTVTVEPSDELIDYVTELGNRAERVRNRAVGASEDNMLKISGDGRRAALDLRLVGQPQTTPGKTTAAANRITAIWQHTRDRVYRSPGGTPYPVPGALQLVFCDLGTPGPHWNIYDDLRGQLVARGLPRESIRYIHEAKTDRDKAQLFAACRSGTVAVLVGSTEKMGVGTNVQDRAIALHHLDAPWRPADVAQREGRIIRQGNLNPEIQIYRYVTQRSFDGYMWQSLQRKSAFIGQVMHNRLDAREINDIGDTALSFSEVKALATGNPLLMDKAEADANLTRLQRAERAHHRTQDNLRQTIARLHRDIARLTQLAADIDTTVTRRQDTRGDRFTMPLEGNRHTKRIDAGRHLKNILTRQLAELDGQRTSTTQPGHLAGFPLTTTAERALGSTSITMALNTVPEGTVHLDATDLRDADPAGLISRLEHRLHRLEDTKTATLDRTEHTRRELTHAEANVGQPFLQTIQLAEARERSRQIDTQLQQIAQPQPTHDQAEPEADMEAGR